MPPASFSKLICMHDLLFSNWMILSVSLRRTVYFSLILLLAIGCTVICHAFDAFYPVLFLQCDRFLKMDDSFMPSKKNLTDLF